MPSSATTPSLRTMILSASRIVLKPVRDGDHGAPLHQPLQSVDHQFFRLGVERGGGFIENKDRRVADDRAGDADALPLAAGERETALAHQGVVALGMRAMNSSRVGQFRRPSTISSSVASGLP